MDTNVPLPPHQSPAAVPPRGFTHLHVHSHFTFLGGTASIDQLVAQAAADGLTHLALTDSNGLYGAVAFSRACRSAGIRPILGMAVTVAPPPDLPAWTMLGPGYVVLLADGPAGYHSLCRLSSAVQGSAERAAVAAAGMDWETLKAHREGLICLSGGRRDWIERLLRAGDNQAALRWAGRLAGVFGERAFLALEIHRPEDEGVAYEVTRLGHRLGMPAVAVQPVFCLARSDQPKLRLLAAIDQNCRLQEVPAFALADGGDPAVDLHWLSPAEVARRFAALPDAVAAVEQVVAQCQPALPSGRAIWPALKLPAGQTPDDALAALAEAGLERRYGPQPAPAIAQRLRRELAAIAANGFSPLFLMVADVVRFAREHDIPVSTRGSVANSLVAYCAGITTVDPIEHDLLFERFIHPARRNPPDIDLDFCSRRRDQVLEYVRDTYGADRTALVAAVSTMRPKSAVRETAKAHGLDAETTERLLRLTPTGWHPDPRRRSTQTLADVAAAMDDVRLRQVLLDAAGLVGQPDHLSVHPGGVVVTPGPLTDFVPVQWTAKGFLITQFDAEDVEAIGLPKLDMLGIRALTVLADTAELVRRHYEPSFRLAAIPPGDRGTGDLLARGDTVGVFQCESSGARRTLRQLRARTVQDLAIANAFFKPGPAMGGMARAFVRRYREEEPVRFLHPALEPILGRTKGVLIFQEQILRIAIEIAGLDWQQADHLRRGMSHFGRAEMEAMAEAFIAGCMRPAPAGPELSEQQARTLWEQVVPFAGYGFNQGHATAYADVSYRSAYLKVHWPAAFLCARLAGWGGFHHPAIYIAEAVRLGIPVHPPHVNHSGRRFTLETSQSSTQGPRAELWMGLGQVRSLRDRAVRATVRERRRRPFTSLRDLLDRVPLQAKEITHLIQCGGLDGVDERLTCRAALLAEAQEVVRAGSVQQLAFDFAHRNVTAETAAERLAWEQRVLGQPVSVTPLQTVGAVEGVALRRLPEHLGHPVTVIAYRLPGWTGGPGFFVSDGDTYVVAVARRGEPTPRAWQPLRLRGRWTRDEWETEWFQVEAMESLEPR